MTKIHEHSFLFKSNYETLQIITEFYGNERYVDDISAIQMLVLNNRNGGSAVEITLSDALAPSALRKLADELENARELAGSRLRKTAEFRKEQISKTLTKLTPDEQRLLGLSMSDIR